MNVSNETKLRGKKNALRILDILCAVSGCFFLLVYIPYFIFHVSKGHAADIAASLLVFAGVLLPFLFRKPLKKLLRRAYTPLKIVWCFVMCFYMISFSVFCVLISGHEDVPVKENDKQQVVVVFGCQIHTEDWLSVELTSRLEKAKEVLDAYPDALCVVSGGKGEDEPVSEAYAMKKWLVTHGIDEKRILTEDNSTDTAQNVAFMLEMLKTKGYENNDCSFICVSSEFHTPRIYLLMTRAGVEHCATVSAVTPIFFNRCVYTVREYMSYVWLLLFG